MKLTLLNVLFFIFSASLYSQDVSSTVKGNNNFAFDLYGNLQKENHNKNIFFSPFSISSALAMTYSGAKKETENSMSKTLHFGSDKKKLNADFNSLLTTLAIKQSGIELNIANSLWAQKDYHFKEDYLQIVKSKYNAGIESVNFKTDDEREKARLMINGWVENKTNNKIKDLLQPGILNDSTKLVLVNAIYFLGKWESEFYPKNTKQSFFYTTSIKESVETFYMNQTAKCKYFENEKLQAIEIPYKENKTSMVIILPKEMNGIDGLEKSITYDKYSDIMNLFRVIKVELTIPKFKISSEFSLKGTLSNLGMAKSFSDSADFSGMTGHKDLKIGNVVHKAFIDVSEQGTEAAAATAVIMTTNSVNIIDEKIFKANHPFLFFIKDNATGSILFFGKIINPTLE